MYVRETLEKNINDLQTQIKNIDFQLTERKQFNSALQLSAYRKLKAKLTKQLQPLKEKFKMYYQNLNTQE